ncbi:hypothetical protein [Caulobacter sp. BE254]|uniref:hypothetical protein n=1 Tax=Caulobacter sp. BE254 TaxID=2817720 RepID=UPI00285A4776|nr:hypothetical protein [Caulobacter sp. BE254]MDR7115490.1 hypothetical protein [Caulobacter sp. BE254]
MILTSIALAAALHLGQPSLSAPRAWPPRALGLPTEGMRRRAGYKIRTKAYHLAGWDMRIQRDGFTGQTRCRLFAPAGLGQGRISYAAGVLGFHLDRDRDVAQAWYSVDDKPPRPWRDDYPALVARRVSLEGGGLANPTGGVVLIPTENLAGARTVTIRADHDATPKRFGLKGFEQALAAARANGCADPAAFVRDPW